MQVSECPVSMHYILADPVMYKGWLIHEHAIKKDCLFMHM